MNEKQNSIKPKRGSLVFLVIYILVVILFSFLALKGASAFGYRFLTFKEAINGGIEFKGGSGFNVHVSATENTDSNAEDADENETDEVDDTENTTQKEEIPATSTDFQKTIEIINNRLKLVNANINIMAVGESDIRVEAAKTVDIDTCRLLSTTALVEIKDIPEETEDEEAAKEAKVVLDSNDIKSCGATYDQQTGTYTLQLNFKDKVKLKTVTSEYLNKSLSFSIDNTQVSEISISSVSDNGVLSISEISNADTIGLITVMINEGHLPTTTEVGDVYSINASFGTDIGSKMIIAIACILAILAIILFLFYKISGIMTFISIASWGLIWTIVFINLGETLNTIILIGMIASFFVALITNVYVLNSIKRSCDDSKKFINLIDQTYSNTTKQIVFANTGIIILGVIIFLVGGASFEGLALSIMLGSACTLISIMIITRSLIKSSINAGIVKESNMFIGAKGGVKVE